METSRQPPLFSIREISLTISIGTLTEVVPFLMSFYLQIYKILFKKPKNFFTLASNLLVCPSLFCFVSLQICFVIANIHFYFFISK